ncbi:hypothetical protein A3A54_02425 [Candidatus Curtissbacteria bacterium RIFCSPLOWO2_01_FULL_39_62]|uniref:Uncharacterized protein n=1 Tax=Candidatus Curtissbacteria bacterium RIFCSPHIGHO2_02_FULL_40_16b TaxID=1797714 RepID=A0A1F5GBN7_9BACT|nr:hypothetical protein [uncultured bacterium]OGD82820.1 MAG: hypothetical protein A2775_01640 [Candidatus Curtissbacteria bacterium RIFCSPHIGHO2_01_FULL_39_57]OGD89292.1 MAG: hypothetical protein A3D04_03675 [Candidatus Curtissbacteria bacterium RIFCSPHIGHO2_02_FULL_40_16b]OGD90932.1 MAG: hypothetical protein A3E11_01740 [Candidatus Curtissbacteria bacterium RIFCSPHIGHO2_12_FULL_38_37]OGD99139.1 MAG: hypothetical protein A3J17_01690 [Candidatus Curtissbacteria bacterium RIFCSPLOWO2_02_FULL_40_
MIRQKTIIITFLLSLSVMLGSAYPVFAQGMMGNNMMNNEDATVGNTDGHTAREEAEGKKIWENLQAQELKCEDLSNDNFGALGEYFMGLMAGEQHEVMNNMMIQMMGEEGEEQMHIVMGKRLSGCDTSAALSTSGMSFMPMMQMMIGGGSTMMGYGGWNNLMGGWGVFGILWLLTWVLIIIALVALIRWLWKKGDKVK